jgi:7-cyano-7-deazaguanine tRNA-ribosyltransferase
MEVVAGLTLKNLRPQVWDPLAPYHLSGLTAVMLSFDELRHRPKLVRQALSAGLSSAQRDRLGHGAFFLWIGV